LYSVLAPACRRRIGSSTADADTGWQSQEEIDYRSVEIPDGYGDDTHALPPSRTPRWVVVTALLLVVLLLHGYAGGLLF
jgi:hypothetical protein